MTYPEKRSELQVLEDRLILLHELVYEFYAQDGCVCGGALHIVLDDGNLRDSDLDFCLKELQLDKWEHIRELGIAILAMLKTLSPAQRLGWYQHDEVADVLAAAGKNIRIGKEGYEIFEETDGEPMPEKTKPRRGSFQPCFGCMFGEIEDEHFLDTMDQVEKETK